MSAFTFRATRVGTETVLAQIVRLVQEAQASAPRIQALADRVVAVFVPVVLAVAAVTFGLWLVFGPSPALTMALVTVVSVLIIACPCAMSLATSTSTLIMVGTGKAAEIGVLFRKGEALQTLREARVIALDKTDTLTKGRLQLTDLAPGFEAETILRLVAALVEAAQERGLAVPPAADFEAVPGFGVTGRVEGQQVVVGADRMAADVVLMSGDLRGIVNAVALSRATLRNISRTCSGPSPTTRR